MGFKKYLNAKNVLATIAAPFTGGLSLGLLNDGDGNSIIGEITGKNSAKQANKQNIALQQETNAKSIDLANTAHQREIADLKAAGLNPVLSAGGQGAATPTLGTAQVQNEMEGGYLGQIGQVANIANTFSSAKSLAQNAKLANAQTENTTVQTKLAGPLAQAEIAEKMAGAGSAKALKEYNEAMKKAQDIENEYHTSTGTAKDTPTSVKTARDIKTRLNSNDSKDNKLINSAKKLRNKIRAKVLGK